MTVPKFDWKRELCVGLGILAMAAVGFGLAVDPDASWRELAIGLLVFSAAILAATFWVERLTRVLR